MSSANFSRPGAIDLSSLKNKPSAPAGAAAAGARGAGVAGAAGAGGGYVVDVTDVAEFDALMRNSSQHPVVVELHSARAQGGAQMSVDLISLAEELDGKILLARVDCDAHPQIAQALGVQAVPTVVAVLGGQLAPLFQGVQTKENIQGVLQQVLQAAVANGMVGRAEPVGARGAHEGEEPAANPRFDAADAAMQRGDFVAATEEFERLLKETPGDLEVLAGKAQAGLLARGTQQDGSEVIRADAEPGNVEAQLAAADAEMMQGNAEAAFTRLVECIRSTAGDEREQVRQRLLELFETLGNSDPVVLKYRRRLATALF